MSPLNKSPFIPEALSDLIESFRLLPSIGPKTAQRLAFATLKMPADQIKSIASALSEIREKIIFCIICQNISQEPKCDICINESRDSSIICVVEEAMDVYVLEKSGVYSGLFHVLHGSLSPANGIGPEEIRINELINRIKNDDRIKEIVVATNLNLEGEATAMYINQVIGESDANIKVTRLARGMPSGSDIEYADETTISHALGSRIKIDESL
ncbi:MAG: recombination protein RecR [Chloroflexi bacterium]|jgi:recombination protein RecR|nr:recombination protein RecR [Chloroflexota bacterium]|tara:strand:+ start:856 stop:1494 length:639 start_codon:yes stop_codon:yes gene_type:complete